MDMEEEIKQTDVKGVCMNCEDPCYECDGSVNKCTSCLRDPIPYLLHLKGKKKATCV